MADDEEKRQLVSSLRATINSVKGGLPLANLNRDYRELEGQNIPFRKYNCSSLEEFIRSLQNDFSLINQYGETLVLVKNNDKVAHVTKLIEKQKAPKRKRERGGKSSRYRSNYNRNSQKPLPRPPSMYNSRGTNNIRNVSSYRSKDPPTRTYNNDFAVYNKSSRREPSPRRDRREPSPRRDRREPSPRRDYRECSPPRQSSNSTGLLQEDQRQSEIKTQLQPVTTQTLPKSSVFSRLGLPISDAPSKPKRILGLGPSQAVSKGQERQTTLSLMDTLHITIKNDQRQSPNHYRETYLPEVSSKEIPGSSYLPSYESIQPNRVTPQRPILHSNLDNRTNMVLPPGNNIRLPSPSNFNQPPPSYYPRVTNLNSPSTSASHRLPSGAGETIESPIPSPGVFEELPENASEEAKLIHLCKYLFNEEPIFNVVPRQPDGKKKSFSTFYATIKVSKYSLISTLPDEFPTKPQALAKVINLALQEFNQLKTEKIARGSKKITDKVDLMADRIYSIVRNVRNGMVSHSVEQQYLEKYAELLPPDWTCNSIIQNHPKLDIDLSGCTGIVYARDVNEEQNIPLLELPESDEWPVFVTMMNSISTIYVRLLNDEYEKPYVEMLSNLDKYMSTKRNHVLEVTVGGFYCIFEENTWLRVRLEGKEMVENKILYRCKLIDHGEENLYSMEELFVLNDEFRNVPAQAVTVNLRETKYFEELFDHSKVEKIIRGTTLYAVVESREDNMVTLYNTQEEPEVNMNHVLFKEICEEWNVHALPEENMYREELYVSFISHADSCIYVQLESLLFKFLIDSILPMNDEDLSMYVVPSVQSINDNKDNIFLAKYNCDDKYYRASISSFNQISKLVTVTFIDYGNVEVVNYNNLIKLFETPKAHLCLIPPQAMKVKLTGIPRFTSDIKQALTKYLVGDEPVILKMSKEGAQIHKRSRNDGKIVNINTLVINETNNSSNDMAKQEIDLSPLEPPIIPNVGTFLDVLVDAVSTPFNFWILPIDDFNALIDLLEDMDTFYTQNQKVIPEVKSEDVKVGASFAYNHKEKETWVRVSVNNKLGGGSVALFLVDFGEIITADIKQLCYLMTPFRKLPAVAIKSKLHDIRPTFVDWSPQDILRFKTLCGAESEEKRTFKCKIEDLTPDLLNHSNDVHVGIKLLDTWSDKDVDIAVKLVHEGIAKSNC